VLIIPSSWGSQLGDYHAPSSNFLALLPGIKRISARGVSRFQSFTLLLFCLLSLLYFCLHPFIKNTKKLVSFIVGISLLLLLVYYVVPYVRPGRPIVTSQVFIKIWNKKKCFVFVD
jgi:hypothetical protein